MSGKTHGDRKLSRPAAKATAAGTLPAEGDREDDLTGFQHAHALFAIDQLAMRGKNRAHPHEIEVGKMGIAQRHLETGELFLVPADALRQKGFGRDEHSGVNQPRTTSLRTRPRDPARRAAPYRHPGTPSLA